MNLDEADRSADEMRAHDARISELESRLEFQDETIQKLNDALVQLQNKSFDQEKRLSHLGQRLQVLAGNHDGADPNQVEPPPPHY